MRTTTCTLLLSLFLVGCSGQTEEADTRNDPAEETTTPLVSAAPEHDWAVKLISGAEDWEPVTKAAVPAHMRDFGLCRAPIPGYDDHGPHGANPFAQFNPDKPESRPTSPANQFIFNPIGRGHLNTAATGNDQDPKTQQRMPVGTVIIKEKYNLIEDANKRINPKAFGVMIKHEPGYDPEHGDWEYAYIEVDEPNTITGATRGKLASCIDCHANRKDTDYVFGSYPLLAQP